MERAVSSNEIDESDLDSLFSLLREETRAADASAVAETRERIVASARRRPNGLSFMQVAAAIVVVGIGGSGTWALASWAFPSAESSLEVALDLEPEMGSVSASSELAMSRDPELGSAYGQSECRPSDLPTIDDSSSSSDASGSDSLAHDPKHRATSESLPYRRSTRLRHDISPFTRGFGVLTEALPSIDEPKEVVACEDLPVGPIADDTGLLAYVTIAEERYYDEASALHFERRDYEAALAAWETYLTKFPTGEFVREAMWNHAKALVYLDRRVEARVELQAIARADGFEPKQRREARALLRSLRNKHR